MLLVARPQRRPDYPIRVPWRRPPRTRSLHNIRQHLHRRGSPNATVALRFADTCCIPKELGRCTDGGARSWYTTITIRR